MAQTMAQLRAENEALKAQLAAQKPRGKATTQTRAEGIQAARTHKCGTCGLSFTKGGLKAHRKLAKNAPRPCSTWKRPAASLKMHRAA